VNICLVVLSDGWAGAETVVHELARHFRDRGENVSVILNQEIYRYYAELENVRLFNIGALFSLRGLARSLVSSSAGSESMVSPARPFPGQAYLTTILREELCYRRLENRILQNIRDNDVDILHAHLTTAIVLGSRLRRKLDIPVIGTLHGTTARGLERPEGVRYWLLPSISWKRRRLAKALGKADMLTAVSDFELDAVENCGIPIRHKSTVIPNGINLLEIQKTKPPVSTLKGGFKLLFPGGGRLVKGGDLLIKALPKVKEQIPTVHLYVAGEVPQGHVMRRLAAAGSLADGVTFVGLLGTTEYRQLLRSVDALVMPSREEGFGIAFLEAMALGKPVIAGNIGGVTGIIENGRTGLLVEPEPSRIADAIILLHERQDVRQEMVRNGMDYVAGFDWRNIVSRYLRLYLDASNTLHHRKANRPQPAN
jgi:glycosyltransferase involved in cell wall biosynthesis